MDQLKYAQVISVIALMCNQYSHSVKHKDELLFCHQFHSLNISVYNTVVCVYIYISVIKCNILSSVITDSGSWDAICEIRSVF